MTHPVLLATRSGGKLRELAPLLGAYGIRVESLADVGLAESAAEQALEEFDSFEENAMAKAQYVAALYPGRIVLADDSGLEVLALDGRPGVRSKRWGGFSGEVGTAQTGAALTGAVLDDANNRYLLDQLAQAAIAGRPDRSARFVCVAACVCDSVSLASRGETAGHIIDAPHGGLGFGYDPLFHSAELGETFSSVSSEAKSAVSHRGRAFRALVALMQANAQLSAKLFGPVDRR